MGFLDKIFDKKQCSVCGGDIGLLGNKKLADGNLCKDCAARLSPLFHERRESTVAEIAAQLEYRALNEQRIAAFSPTLTLGGVDKLIVDENAGCFVVSRMSRWREYNPDVIDFGQVMCCETDVREQKTEVFQKDEEGHRRSFDPPRYDVDYRMYVTIKVDSPYFGGMTLLVNDGGIERRPSVEYREAEYRMLEMAAVVEAMRRGEALEAARAAFAQEYEAREQKEREEQERVCARNAEARLREAQIRAAGAHAACPPMPPAPAGAQPGMFATIGSAGAHAAGAAHVAQAAQAAQGAHMAQAAHVAQEAQAAQGAHVAQAAHVAQEAHVAQGTRVAPPASTGGRSYRGAETWACPHCGTVNEGNFCQNCGARRA